MIADLYLTYSFISKLATPFEDWEAFKLGIIDADGREVKPISKLKLQKERDAYGYFDRVVAKVKRLLATVPGGSSKIGTYAAALWFIKEDHDQDDDTILEALTEYVERVQLVEDVNARFERMIEDAPVMSAGSGAVAGIGIGQDGEPGVSKKKQKQWSRSNSSGR